MGEVDVLSAFALTRVVADSAELMLLAVNPTCRRRRLGLTLLEAVRDEARRRGAAHLFAEVRDGNPALVFYQSQGFQVVGRRTDYYRDRTGHRYDALTVRLCL